MIEVMLIRIELKKDITVISIFEKNTVAKKK